MGAMRSRVLIRTWTLYMYSVSLPLACCCTLHPMCTIVQSVYTLSVNSGYVLQRISTLRLMRDVLW